MLNQVLTSFQYLRSAAVVQVQNEDPRSFKASAEVQDVSDASSREAVDALPVVSADPEAPAID